MLYPESQEVFDAGVRMPAEVIRAHFIVDEIQLKHKEYIIKHGKFPMEYHDDLAAAAEKHGFEFVHPKYTAGLKVVEPNKTVH